MNACKTQREGITRHYIECHLPNLVGNFWENWVDVPAHSIVNEDACRLTILVADDFTAFLVLVRQLADLGQNDWRDPCRVDVDAVQDNWAATEEWGGVEISLRARQLAFQSCSSLPWGIP